MGSRWPGGASTPAGVDEMLQAAGDAIGKVPAQRWELDPAPQAAETTAQFGGLLAGTQLFDALHFAITPAEAEVMDPQQRVLLELAYAALEDSGHRPGDLQRRVGVFVGANWNRYRSHCLDTRPDVVESFGHFATSLANEHDFLATRISHKLDLRGPSATVSTACSTSLVAIVQAARALLNGSCDLALAGGASITVPTVDGDAGGDHRWADPHGVAVLLRLKNARGRGPEADAFSLAAHGMPQHLADGSVLLTWPD